MIYESILRVPLENQSRNSKKHKKDKGYYKALMNGGTSLLGSECTRMFTKYDSNSDGQLQEDEILAMTHKIFEEKLGLAAPDITPFITLYDKDKSNGLDPEEFKEFFKAYLAAVLHVGDNGTEEPSVGLFKQGERIQYLSASQQKWISCKVTEVRSDGAVQVDVKKGYWISVEEQPSKLRGGKDSESGGGGPIMKEGSGGDYTADEKLLYFSDSKKTWLKCNCSKDGGVQIDIKKGYWMSREEQSEKLQESASGSMEYFSQSSGQWIPCSIVADGAIQINVKTGYWFSREEQLSKIKARGEKTTQAEIQPGQYQQGQELEYYSISNKKWIPCKVLAVREDGAIQVSVKEGQWMDAGDQGAKVRLKNGAQAAIEQEEAIVEEEEELSGGQPAYELTEKAGMLYDEDMNKGRVNNIQEAEAMVKANPQKYCGFTFQKGSTTNVMVREQGCKLLASITAFNSMLLTCKSVNYSGPLFEDEYTPGRSRFEGGLENGKGKQNPWATWKRPGRGEGLADRAGIKLFGSIDPNDIMQGGVGDCWLLSAMAALAEFPGMVMKLFNGRNSLSGPGRYPISLWSWKYRKWKTLEVDDRLAVKDAGVDPVFAKISKDGELWPALIEKASAILCGGFDYIDGNHPTFALGMLTGCDQVFHYTQRANTSQWTGNRSEFTADRCPTYSMPVESKDEKNYKIPNDPKNGKIYSYMHYHKAWADGTSGEQSHSNSQMWREMVNWDRKNYVMIADTCGNQGKSDSQTYPCGLPYTHAYSLIRVESNVAGTGVNLCQIRNPHGTGEPNLDWKDDDPKWKQYPQVAQALQPDFKDDGTFWCTDADFFRHFNNVFVVKCSMDARPQGAVRKNL